MDVLRSYLIKSDAFLLGRKKLEKTSSFLVAIGVVFFSLIAWSSLAYIDKVVRIEGKVIPTGRSRPIQHLEGGIVSAIFASEGAFVKKGDVLLEIDATSAGSNLNENKIKLSSARARSIRLRAESEDNNTLIFPDNLKKEEVIKGEIDLFLSRKAKLESELRVHNETIRQYKASLSEAESQRKNYTNELNIAQKRVQMLEGMAARKAASQMELLEAQSREQRLQTEVQNAQMAKPKIEAALAAEQARASSITAEYRTQAQNELVEVLAEIDRLSQVITTAEDRVNRTEVRAPIDGTINRLGVTSVGSVIKPGESVIELTPTSNDVLVEAHVLPKDRGELQPQIRTKIRVSAYDSAALGVLKGFLKEISADTMLDAQGNAYYRATIAIDTLPPSYHDNPVLPGMTVTGDLVIGRRTMLSHFLSPFRKFTNNMFRDSR